MYVLFQTIVGSVAVFTQSPERAISRAEETLAVMFPDVEFQLMGTSESDPKCLTYPCR